MAQEFTINLNIASSAAPSTEKQKLQETLDPNKKKEEAGETGDKEKDKEKEMIKGLNAKVAYRFVVGKANQIISTRVSSVGARYGDEALQNRINNIAQTVSKATTTAGGMVFTAVSGNYVALAIQAISAVLTETLSIVDRVNNFNLGLMQEEREISKQSERLGIVASKGGR